MKWHDFTRILDLPLTGVEQALYFGAIDCSAVETILRQRQLSETQVGQEELQSFIPTKAMQWDFDLNSYAELCKEVAL